MQRPSHMQQRYSRVYLEGGLEETFMMYLKKISLDWEAENELGMQLESERPLTIDEELCTYCKDIINWTKST